MTDQLSPMVSIFISYHHSEDEQYFNDFDRLHTGTYDILRDSPAARQEDPPDTEMIVQRILENYLNKTVCTLVFCGPYTRWRKYVDCEIKAALLSRQGLIGVNLPSNPHTASGHVNIPERLNDNINSGYALWVSWEDITSSPGILEKYIKEAVTRHHYLIRNKRPLRNR